MAHLTPWGSIKHYQDDHVHRGRLEIHDGLQILDRLIVYHEFCFPDGVLVLDG